MKNIETVTVKGALYVICNQYDLLDLIESTAGGEVAALVRAELAEREKEVAELEKAVEDLEREAACTSARYEPICLQALKSFQEVQEKVEASEGLKRLEKQAFKKIIQPVISYIKNNM